MSDSSTPRFVRSADRGQTLHDYAVGISLFVLATAFVVSTIPTVFTPFAAPVSADQTAQADRVAAEVMDNVTREGSETIIDEEATQSFFADESNLDDVPLPSRSDVNVSLVAGDGTVQAAIGPPFRNRSTAAATRIVTEGDGGRYCTSTCRIEVRIW